MRSGAVVRELQPVLHGVVGIPRSGVEGISDLIVVDGGPVVGDAGRDELSGRGVLTDDVGLPADELGGLLGLEATPGDVVLGLRVAIGCPQIVPGRESVRPVDEAPLTVEAVDVAVTMTQVVHEALEDAAVVKEMKAGFVVDLEADDGGMPRVAIKDPVYHPFRMEEEGRVREIYFLPSPPGDPFSRGSFAGDFRIQPGQPRRHGIRGRAKDDGDAPSRGTVENWLEPVQIELAVLRFPGRPDRLTDSDDREVRLLHEIEVDVQPVIRLVLVVVGRTEQHPVGTGRHRPTPVVVDCPGHSLTFPAVNVGICAASAFAPPPTTKVSSRSSADTK